MPDYRDKHVLVTGAGGFIGRELVALLLGAGAKVTALLRPGSSTESVYSSLFVDRSKLRVIRADIRDPAAVATSMQGQEYIFHLAAIASVSYSIEHPDEVCQTNMGGLVNVLVAARELTSLKRLLVASSSEVFGEVASASIDEKSARNGRSPYAATKISADYLATSFFHSYGLPVVIMRPFNTYGPGQSSGAVIPSILSQALRGKKIHVGNASVMRDFIYVRDTANAFLVAGLADGLVLGEDFNIGSGVAVEISNLVSRIAGLIGTELQIEQDSKKVRNSSLEVSRLCSDISKAKRLLGWEPQYSLDQGLALTLEWMRSVSA